MTPFDYQQPSSVKQALAAIKHPGAKFIGGGTNLIDLMKGGVETPAHLIDINRLPLAGIENTPDGGLVIGALVRNSDAAANIEVRQRYPLLAQALLSGASGQLRNAATIGGNLLQRTRCYYFYDSSYAECNKRDPGSGCAARAGFNRIHAIFGASDSCVATNPSDMNVALLALDAVVQVEGPRGRRDIPLAEFHRLPGDHPERDTNLLADELILAVALPPSPFASNCHYLKVRDRASYAFALVSVAAALEITHNQITRVRLAMGGVAHKPWRLTEVEAALLNQPCDDAHIASAAALTAAHAVPLRYNGFKVELAQRAVQRALHQAGALA